MSLEEDVRENVNELIVTMSMMRPVYNASIELRTTERALVPGESIAELEKNAPAAQAKTQAALTRWRSVVDVVLESIDPVDRYADLGETELCFFTLSLADSRHPAVCSRCHNERIPATRTHSGCSCSPDELRAWLIAQPVGSTPRPDILNLCDRMRRIRGDALFLEIPLQTGDPGARLVENHKVIDDDPNSPTYRQLVETQRIVYGEEPGRPRHPDLTHEWRAPWDGPSTRDGNPIADCRWCGNFVDHPIHRGADGQPMIHKVTEADMRGAREFVAEQVPAKLEPMSSSIPPGIERYERPQTIGDRTDYIIDGKRFERARHPRSVELTPDGRGVSVGYDVYPREVNQTPIARAPDPCPNCRNGIRTTCPYHGDSAHRLLVETEARHKARIDDVPIRYTGDFEDRLEAAYWRFDAARAGGMAERDAFKSMLRSMFAPGETLTFRSLDGERTPIFVTTDQGGRRSVTYGSLKEIAREVAGNPSHAEIVNAFDVETALAIEEDLRGELADLCTRVATIADEACGPDVLDAEENLTRIERRLSELSIERARLVAENERLQRADEMDHRGLLVDKLKTEIENLRLEKSDLAEQMRGHTRIVQEREELKHKLEAAQVLIADARATNDGLGQRAMQHENENRELRDRLKVSEGDAIQARDILGEMLDARTDGHPTSIIACAAQVVDVVIDIERQRDDLAQAVNAHTTDWLRLKREHSKETEALTTRLDTIERNLIKERNRVDALEREMLEVNR